MTASVCPVAGNVICASKNAVFPAGQAHVGAGFKILLTSSRALGTLSRREGLAMNPAYQGQLDVFCAAYAVINAMRHMHATRLLTCRALLHEALLDAAGDEDFFKAILDQRTDYADWVDAMLGRLEKQGSLLTARPFPTSFPGPDAPSPDALWEEIAAWLRKGERNAVLLQFVRVLYPTDAVIRHWTCCNDAVGDTLMLFDSSIEPGSLHQLDRKSLITDPALDGPGKVLIVPYTLRFLRPRIGR